MQNTVEIRNSPTIVKKRSHYAYRIVIHVRCICHAKLLHDNDTKLRYINRIFRRSILDLYQTVIEYSYNLWWYHDMVILSVLLTVCVGNHRASRDKEPVAENLDTALVTSVKLYWTNSWIDVDSRRRTAHVMLLWSQWFVVILEIIAKSEWNTNFSKSKERDNTEEYMQCIDRTKLPLDCFFKITPFSIFQK